jgi:hypothetical protein
MWVQYLRFRLSARERSHLATGPPRFVADQLVRSYVAARDNPPSAVLVADLCTKNPFTKSGSHSTIKNPFETPR